MDTRVVLLFVAIFTVVVVVLVIYCGGGESGCGGENGSGGVGGGVGGGGIMTPNVRKRCNITIEYNLHDSLPSDWVNEFYIIMENLNKHFPALDYHGPYCEYTLYAWNSVANQPYGGDMSGASVSGDKIILEIPSSEIFNKYWHRYSVIVHEYYHVYQLCRSGGTDCKWIMEGCASCFESLYIKEHYNVNYFDQQQHLSNDVLIHPVEYENYEKRETNYSNSVFMVLALHKELVLKGDSVALAFSKILRDYWQDNVKYDWKLRFEYIFGFSVSIFYSRLANYELNLYKVLPDNYPKIHEYAHG